MSDIDGRKITRLLIAMGELVAVAVPVGQGWAGEITGYLVPTEAFVKVMNGLCDLGGPEVVCPECPVKNREDVN